MRRPDETTRCGAGLVEFPVTLWSVVLEAKSAEPERARRAIGELCAHYREAIVAYFQVKCRHWQDGEDLAGDFIAHLLERNQLASFDPQGCPRFRLYLSAALKHFFYDWVRKRAAAKRGDGTPDESFERLREGGIEFPCDDAQLNRAVDLAFARSVHQRVMAALKAKMPDPQRFAALSDFIPFEQGEDTSQEAAKRIGLSAAAFRKAVFDQRRNYVQFFRAEVASTVGGAQKEAEDEASQLLDLLPEAVAVETRPGTAAPTPRNAKPWIP
ncbi:MAG: hypothetical protein C5B50_26025 [Verrucomicrobia bacterium]|nr:MAG: hypothetical protein C5B50_26025 [Verrucomicrobiota bacterium]